MSKLFKIIHRLEALGVSLQPLAILCAGSKQHPDCRIPLFIDKKTMEARDKIIYAFQISRVCPKKCVVTVKDFPDEIVTRICPHCGGPLVDDEEDHQIYGEIFDKCFCCVVEHPAMLSSLGSKQVSAAKYMRKVLGLKYAT